MPPQIGQRLFKTAAHGVKTFVHVAQVGGIQALKSDQHALTAAVTEQLQKFVIVRGVDARLAHPSNLQRGERAEKFLRLVEIRRDVVVDEKEQAFVVFD